MKVGVSYWGICSNLGQHRYIDIDTPDGHRYGRPILFRELLKKGHRVISLQRQREPNAFQNSYDDGDGRVEYCLDNDRGLSPFPDDIDVIFMEWRWPTHKNDRSHPQHDPSRYEDDLERQLELLDAYHGKCPIIVWDTDLKVSVEDEERWPEVIWADPTLKGNRLTKDRASLPFWTDWKELFPVREPLPNYGYVGNRYEREEEFKSYYYDTSEFLRARGVQTTMFGNWLQRSPERPDPSILVSDVPTVAFGHRMGFYDSMKLMNSFICTTHVSKDRYYETGFISPRYMEALAVGCPGLVPKGMADSVGHILGDRWTVEPYDVCTKVKELQRMNLSLRQEVVEEQRESLKKFGSFDVKSVIDFIEEKANDK